LEWENNAHDNKSIKLAAGEDHIFQWEHGSSRLYVAEMDGTQTWESDGSYTDVGDRLEGVAPTQDDGCVVATEGGLKKYDSSGTKEWDVLQSRNFSENMIFAVPRFGVHKNHGNWKLKGTVELNGSGVQGAKVHVFDEDHKKHLTTVTTDSNGDYRINDGELGAGDDNPQVHVYVQYTDGSGNKYNAQSKPYVNP
jgi:hypothetical protein